jgi:hypothetical protein
LERQPNGLAKPFSRLLTMGGSSLGDQGVSLGRDAKAKDDGMLDVAHGRFLASASSFRSMLHLFGGGRELLPWTLPVRAPPSAVDFRPLIGSR